MLCTHPYSLWPLHVKLFTKEVAKAWTECSSIPKPRKGQTVHEVAAPPELPEGLAVSIELEGVDGKSGAKGSGRSGPISVSDGRSL
jgi:structure-specific endonuclease subunit SLX1